MRFVKTVENLFGLPQGFTRVEYLESSGTQYIDTGFKPNPATTRFELSYSTTSSSTFPFGSRINSSFPSTDSCTSYISSTSVRGDWAGTNSIAFSTTSGRVNILICEDNKMTLNGSDYQGTVDKSSSYLDYNFLLFNMWDGSSGVRATGFTGKFYKAKLWDNGTLVRDYIPCIDPFGVACMYDLVGKKPYYNQGTGTFTVGRQIIPVEYLEGTGTQYIDTDVRGFADFEIGIKLRESVSNVSIFCGNNYRLERYNASNPYWRFRNDNDFYNSGVPITEYHVMEWKNDEVYADGVKLQDFAKTWNVSANMTLFGASASGSYPSMIYFCKLWNPTDGTLLRDYIPCKDENDNGFLFDKVSGVCYLNNGTGNFAFGENKYKTKLRLIKDNKLPAGYTQVEYLESTGTQYIDTGVLPSEDLRTKIVQAFTGTDIAKNSSILGSNGYNVNNRYWINYDKHFEIGYGNFLATDVVVQPDEVNTIDFNYIKNGSHYFSFNGTEYTTTGTPNTQYSIVLFGRVVSTQEPILAPQRIYKVQFIRNGVLVRDFIPVLDWNMTPCMYDMVTKTPFYNSGTGTFATGKPILPMVRFIKDIVPREYAVVNYIESTGTQYIDTGIEGKDGITAEARIQRTTTSSNECFVGAFNLVNRLWLAYTFGGQWYRGYNALAGGWTPSTPITDWYTIKSSIPSAGTIVFDCNGISRSDTYVTGFTTGVNVMLFQMGNTTTDHYPAQGKMSYCKLYDGNNLVRNFIPVVRRIDKVAGMWDTVTKQFFTTPVGAFNYG